MKKFATGALTGWFVTSIIIGIWIAEDDGMNDAFDKAWQRNLYLAGFKK